MAERRGMIKRGRFNLSLFGCRYNRHGMAAACLGDMLRQADCSR